MTHTFPNTLHKIPGGVKVKYLKAKTNALS